MPELSPSARTPEPAPIEGTTRLSRLRAIALPIVIVAGILLFGRVMHAHYPIQRWLFWRYAEYWLLSLGWSAACVSAGSVVVTRVLGRALPTSEHAAVSFAVGLYVFFLGMILGGLIGIYGTPFFIALPLGMLASGARPAARRIRRFARHVRSRRERAPGASPWALPIIVFGLLGIGMVYFAILTPNNVAFDSRWQHLAVAEHYVAEGAVRPFPEGWFVGASPHLASFVYTWAFLLPKSTLFDRVELSAHLEFVSFLWTLVGIPALVRLLVPSLRHPGKPGAPRSLVGVSWAVRFLFPGIFLYDSSLCLGADHMAAVFAVPIYALLVRAYRELSPRACALFAMMLAGAFLTKYTASLTLLGLPVLAVLGRALWLAIHPLVQRLRRKSAAPPIAPPGAWYRGPLVAFAAGLAFTAPHWIVNWVFYGDPLYPVLYKHFTSRQWTPDTSDRFKWGYLETDFWKPAADLAGAWQTFKALFTFSFIPNDWPKFHGHVPVFGSLFTLSLFFLPFLHKTKRLWGLFAAVHVGLVCWYCTHHQDRYLQTMLPWMAVAAAGVLMLVWRTHVFNRAALTALVALQIVWGGDVYFIPGHAMIHSPLPEVIQLLSSGYRKDEKSREAGLFAPFSDVARVLPKHAKVLVHQTHPHLGLEAMSVNDFTVNQGGISYGRLGSSRAVYDLYKGYGVTHLLYSTGETGEAETLAGDLVFWSFAKRFGKGPRPFGSFVLAGMPDAPPPPEASNVVAVFVCPGGAAPGLYHLPDLHVPAFGPRHNKFPPPFQATTPGGAAELVAGAAYAILEPRCAGLSGGPGAGFERLARRKSYEFWGRTAN